MNEIDELRQRVARLEKALRYACEFGFGAANWADADKLRQRIKEILEGV